MLKNKIAANFRNSNRSSGNYVKYKTEKTEQTRRQKLNNSIDTSNSRSKNNEFTLESNSSEARVNLRSVKKKLKENILEKSIDMSTLINNNSGIIINDGTINEIEDEIGIDKRFEKENELFMKLDKKSGNFKKLKILKDYDKLVLNLSQAGTILKCNTTKNLKSKLIVLPKLVIIKPIESDVLINKIENKSLSLSPIIKGNELPEIKNSPKKANANSLFLTGNNHDLNKNPIIMNKRCTQDKYGEMKKYFNIS